ncbi:hypothetical protein [Virgisporangium aurantiacum]|uniref:Uncharacterized protein n=1 Tax=Virgisporangium aurantiacum TaxID=175570 RepID=A0A8J3ZBZ1_9ACTN|nr:hypothetical protein [Virgisporangium aurantiacum]GIJ58895.1 hypothetical protein Vau01_064110 [Virgisporangium aurantiacum]
MAVEFRRQSIKIPAGTGRRSFKGSAAFSRSVTSAGGAIEGFKFDFLDNDHHINTVEVDVDVTGTPGNTVEFTVECLYADKNFDDRYEGYVSVLVIAETT